MRQPPERSPAASTGADATPKDAMRDEVERQLQETSADDETCLPPPIPDHVLLRRIGSGAYGDVWLARNALGTLRAVKIVYRAHFKDDRPYEREFNGILKYEPISRTHEGLVQVLHVGRNDEAGCFYYVMELADPVASNQSSVISNQSGAPSAKHVLLNTDSLITAYSPRTLRSELAQRQRLPPTEAAQLVLRLAGALAHLHAHGLVHRDIKPSNVIFVAGQPKLADIGLVTDVGSSHSFVGTEGFIPPEGPGTPQADLYGLGKLVYELATGRDRLDFPQLPQGVTQLPEADALLELNEVMTRACAPAPQERYATATELQADLNLFLAGRSLRRVRYIERHLARLKRLAAAACALLVMASAVVWFAKREARHAKERQQSAEERAHTEATLRQRAEAAEHDQSRLRQAAENATAREAESRRRAEAQELAARKKAYAADMNLLRQALAADDLGRAQDLLNKQRPHPGQQDLRGWEWRYYWQFCRNDAAFTLCQRSNWIVSVAFSPDGTLLAAGTVAGEVTVWDVATRQMIFRKSERSGGSGRLAFSPNSDLLAFPDRSNDQQSIVLWNSRSRSEDRRLPVRNSIHDLAFSQDGRLFTAELGRTNNLTVWNVANGTVAHRFSAQFNPYGLGSVFEVARDGSEFIYASGTFGARTVRLVEIPAKRSSTFPVADEFIAALAFSSDGKMLATSGGYSESAIKLWVTHTRQLLGSLEGHRNWVTCLKFLPDGETLVSASADRTVRFWEVATRRLIRTLHGRIAELLTLDVSPDGRRLAAGCKDGSVMFWDLRSSPNRPPAYRTRGSIARPWAYSPDSRIYGFAEPALGRSQLRLRDATTHQPIDPPPVPLTKPVSFAFSSDMRLFLATDYEGKMAVWDMRAQQLVTNFVAHSGPVALVRSEFLRNGKSVLTYCLGTERVLKEWDTATWQELHRWPINADQTFRVVSPGADWIALANENGWFELISVRDPAGRWRFKGEDRLRGIDLSPDGKTLAAASENGTVELWDTTTRTRSALLQGVLLGYHSVAISPDGQRVAAGSNGQDAIKLWDLASHEEVATLAGQGSTFTDLKFSPDGHNITARNWAGETHFWSAPSWQEIEAGEKRDAGSTP